MTEIRDLPRNGRKFVSTFSGCGGSCLGFEMAGYELLWASEFVDAARETHVANHRVHVDPRDIRDVTASDILAHVGLEPGELDVFEGSPPCKSFSLAGHGHANAREGGWGKEREYSDGTAQRTDDLFFEYVRLLRDIRPKAFVAENVPGLVSGMARGYFKSIIRELAACGYRVEAACLEADRLGVPQSRRRLVFVGIREDIGIAPPFPDPLPHRFGVRDAIADIVDGEVVAWVRNDRRRRDADNRVVLEYYDAATPCCTIVASSVGDLYRSFYDVGVLIRPPRCIEDFSTRPEWVSGYPKTKEQAKPIIARSRRTRDSVEPRVFTIAELRRVCGFPDDFVLTGTERQQWERLGRAVPPPMMMRVAESLHVALTAAGA